MTAWVEAADPENIRALFSRVYIRADCVEYPNVAIDIRKKEQDSGIAHSIYMAKSAHRSYYHIDTLPKGLEKEFEEMIAIANEMIKREV